jgi:hypothetical protein
VSWGGSGVIRSRPQGVWPRCGSGSHELARPARCCPGPAYARNRRRKRRKAGSGTRSGASFAFFASFAACQLGGQSPPSSHEGGRQRGCGWSARPASFASFASFAPGRWRRTRRGHPARAAAALLHAARQAAEALATPDADLDHERAEIAAALAAEARGGFGQPMSDADHRAALAGLSAAALQRPPGWSDPADSPPPGAWCSCCGRQHRAGGRWWREAAEPKGWRCWTCHPPVHLSGAELAEVRT